MRDYRKIIAWQRAHKLTLAVYGATETFPKEEVFGLTSQLRRASSSAPTNIVEGATRESKRDYLRFLNIAASSLSETEYLLLLAHDLRYLDDVPYEELTKKVNETHAPLSGLTVAVRKESKGLASLIALVAIPIAITALTFASTNLWS